MTLSPSASANTTNVHVSLFQQKQQQSSSSSRIPYNGSTPAVLQSRSRGNDPSVAHRQCSHHVADVALRKQWSHPNRRQDSSTNAPAPEEILYSSNGDRLATDTMTFLDPYPIVLLATESYIAVSGGITMVRVHDEHDDYRELNETAITEDISTSEYVSERRTRQRRQRSSNGTGRGTGTLLVEGLDCRPSDARQQHSYPIDRIQSLRGGESFAVGVQDGQYHIVSTERAASGITGDSFWATTSTSSDSYSSWQQKQRGMPSIPAEYCPFPPPPQRRYARDDNLLLRHQFLGLATSRTQGLREYTDWPQTRLESYITDRIMCCPGPAGVRTKRRNKWDFWDNGSHVLALHVGAEADYFSIGWHDDRCHVGSSQQHVVVDLTEDKSSGMVQDSTLATCFLSDQVVATYHCVQGRRDNSVTAFIKLWDLRHMRKSLPSSLVLLSFPRDSVLASKACQTCEMDLPMGRRHGIQALANGKLLWWANNDNLQLHGLSVLEASTGRMSSGVATKPPFGEWFSLLPASTNRPCHTVTALNHPHGNTDIVSLDVESFLQTTEQLQARQRVSQGRKREHPDGCNEDDVGWGDNVDDSGHEYISTLHLNCRDEHGCHSITDSLARNHDGSMLVCGSADDGLLFVIRTGGDDI